MQQSHCDATGCPELNWGVLAFYPPISYFLTAASLHNLCVIFSFAFRKFALERNRHNKIHVYDYLSMAQAGCDAESSG